MMTRRATTPEGDDPVAVEGRYAMRMLNEWRLAEIRRRRAERSATVEREADREIADLIGHADALAAEIERLRAANEAMTGACRHASSEIRRAAAMPGNCLYGLGSIAVNLDAALADAGPGAGEGKADGC